MVINNFNKAVINSPEDSKFYVIKGRLPRMQNGEVLIKVIASGLSFTDTMICKDIYPEMSVKFPLCPGYDIIGEVVKSTSDSIKVGETVCALTFVGGCSEYICLSAHKVVVVPKKIDPIKPGSRNLSK